ncbi:MAG: hypothetical protein GXO19_03750 [Epsilonproteobacteria bacterium]|nr:hypothetical protein [Campylobacterota bacterium]NPA56834.1 hypothetical protein [Campylobacterota bacterium]
MSEIHGKRLIAVAGRDAFGKRFISTVNGEIAPEGLMAIGINIDEAHFDTFISNLPASKVEITIFMAEYQRRGAEYFGLDGYLIAALKRGGEMVFVTSPHMRPIDDRELLTIIREEVKPHL